VVIDQVVEERGIQDGRGVELLSRYGSADHSENARAYDGTDTQRGERPGAKRFLQ
jgi:hypothetical protein